MSPPLYEKAQPTTMDNRRLQGVFAAALTPLNRDFSPDLNSLPAYLGFLARRGCHGALLLGTTGEGPSFSPEQRLEIYRAAVQVRESYPDFLLLAGTGTPSLDETISLTQNAFDLGFDGVVVLPPYYFRKASEAGLQTWYSQVINRAVPRGAALLGYHIPGVSGVPLSLDLLARLKDAHPDRFAGLKDSSGEVDFAGQLGDRFDGSLLVFSGTDQLFSLALQSGASGCITAPANLISPDLREIWDSHREGQSTEAAQNRVNRIRSTLENYLPYPPLLKALLARLHGFPRWPVCPPLLPLSEEIENRVLAELERAG
jgi:4-hydroxy-tetrahydrodipicolinate synthase